MQTSNGYKLDYTESQINLDITKMSKLKFSEADIRIVNDYKTIKKERRLTYKKLIDILKKDHGISISQNTIRKIWNNKYSI